MVENETKQVQENEPEVLRSPYRVRGFSGGPNIPLQVQQWLNEQATEGFVLHTMTHSSVYVPRQNGGDIRPTCIVVVESSEPVSLEEET